MFHIQGKSGNAVQSVRATGTIMASDLRELFEHSDMDTDTLKAVAIVIDPDFDGYLAEIATGLRKELRRLNRADFKVALIMPENMLKEAALMRLASESGQVRLCPEAQSAQAMAWLAE